MNINDKIGQAVQGYSDTVLTKIVNPLTTLFVVFVFILFLYFATKTLWQGGNDIETLKDGKQGMLYGIIGLTIMVSAIAIVWFVANTGDVFLQPPADKSATNGLKDVKFIEIRGGN